MDKKEFDKAVIEESKERNKLDKKIYDGGNYTSRTFDATNDLDWVEPTFRENAQASVRHKDYKISPEDKVNLASLYRVCGS